MNAILLKLSSQNSQIYFAKFSNLAVKVLLDRGARKDKV